MVGRIKYVGLQSWWKSRWLAVIHQPGTPVHGKTLGTIENDGSKWEYRVWGERRKVGQTGRTRGECGQILLTENHTIWNDEIVALDDPRLLEAQRRAAHNEMVREVLAPFMG